MSTVFSTECLLGLLPRSNWNLDVLVFEERGKPEYPEKNLSEQGQTKPTYDTGTGSQIWVTLVGGEPSHHCAIHAPQVGRDTCV